MGAINDMSISEINEELEDCRNLLNLLNSGAIHDTAARGCAVASIEKLMAILIVGPSPSDKVESNRPVAGEDG